MTGPHYFEPDPKVASRPKKVRLDVPGAHVELMTDRGVFSYERLDQGTEILLRKAPLPPEHGDILDLGCGYGPIAIACALRSPSATVWAIDSNSRAQELTRRNAEEVGLGNVRVGEVPEDLRFDAIYSNPPIRIGKPALHDLLMRWISRLKEDARAYLVVHRNLGSDSLVKWFLENGCAAKRLSSTLGYRIIEVSPE